MKKFITFTLALSMLVLSSCSKNNAGTQLTPEERTELYSSAITGARTQEENEAFEVMTTSDAQDADLIFQFLGLSEEDMTSYAISISLMNVKAYGVAAIMPAEGKEETVKDAMQSFIDTQKMNFEFYLPDQLEVAESARLETLEDGTVLMVMCEDQDTVYDSIVNTIMEQ